MTKSLDRRGFLVSGLALTAAWATRTFRAYQRSL